jgi:hypothetical protein
MVGTATATTTTVLRLPQRALSAVVKAPSNLFNLITGAAKARWEEKRSALGLSIAAWK